MSETSEKTRQSAAITLDYESPKTRFEDQRRKEYFNPSRALSLFTALIALIVVFGPDLGERFYGFCYAFILIPVAVLTALRLICRRLGMWVQYASHDRYWRWTFWILLCWAICSVRYDHCPHAKYLAIGPYTYVFDGVQCGNQRHFKSVLLYPLYH